MKARGRFDVVVVFKSGGYIRLTSRKERSLTPQEIVDQLRTFCNQIDHGIRAEAEADQDTSI
jgi:hypothetical protein